MGLQEEEVPTAKRGKESALSQKNSAVIRRLRRKCSGALEDHPLYTVKEQNGCWPGQKSQEITRDSFVCGDLENVFYRQISKLKPCIAYRRQQQKVESDTF